MSALRCCYVLLFLTILFSFPAYGIIVPCDQPASTDPTGLANCQNSFVYSGTGVYTAPSSAYTVNLSGIVKVSYGSSGCTGELISAFTVLTAGHCINPYISSTPIITFGDGSSVTGTSYSMPQSYESTIDPGTGKGNSTLGTDLAVITLSSAAPSWATIYQLYTGSSVPYGQLLTIAGYGNTGVGCSMVAGSCSDAQSGDTGTGYGTLRAGQNEYVENGFQLAGWSSNLLVGDFDNGYAAYDSLGYLGNSNTVMIDHGDSGGPTFYTVGGVTELVGVHDLLTCLSSVANGPCIDSASTTLNGAYGQIYADTSVAGNIAFIDSVITPEPSTWTLLLAAIPAVSYWKRRRQA